MKKAPAGKKGYYVHLKEGSLYQIHYGREKDYSITFRARGKGKLQAGYYRYHYFPAEKNKLKYIDSKYPFPSIQLTDQWKEYRYEYHKQYDDEIFAPLFKTLSGEVMLDDVEIKVAPRLLYHNEIKVRK